jgi:hypothetical protein
MKATNAKPLPLEARAVQCITQLAAPKTTQDSVDQLCAEFATAYLLRQQSEKRYEAVKAQVVDVYENDIAGMRNEASNSMNKVSHIISGEDWNLKLSVNKPATRCDVDELRTELIKQGVNVTIIDRAIGKVSKKATPALIIAAQPAE